MFPVLSYIHDCELPEVFKLRIELLIEQHCGDIALNLLSWCVKSALLQDDVFVRKTHLCLLHESENESFHSSVRFKLFVAEHACFKFLLRVIA